MDKTEKAVFVPIDEKTAAEFKAELDRLRLELAKKREKAKKAAFWAAVGFVAGSILDVF